MKKTRLLTSLSTLALVLSLGACDASLFEQGQKEFAISFESNGYVYAIDLPESADEGDKVEFKLTTESGFYIDEVEAGYVVESRYTILDLDGSNEAGYSFVMPAADVTISANALAGYFAVSYDDDLEVFVDYNYNRLPQRVFIRGIYEQGTGEEIGTGSKVFVQAGSEVMVVGYRQDSAENIRFFLDGEELEQITDPDINAGMFAFGFVMPNRNCELTVTATEKYVNVTLEENDFIDAYLYLADDPDTHLTRITNLKVNNDKVYLHAELKSDVDERYTSVGSAIVGANIYDVPNQYGIATTWNTWDTAWSSTSSSTSGGNFAYVDANTKFLQIPSWYYVDNELVISTEPYDTLKYADYNFIGDWKGSEIYNSAEYEYGKGLTMKIDTAGNVTGSVNSSVASVNDNGPLLADGRQLFVSADGNLSAIYWSTYGSLNANDIYLFAHTTDSVTFDCFKIWGSVQYIVEVFVGSDSYGLLYADNDTEKILNFDVTIQFTNDFTSLDELNVAEGTYPTFDVLDADGNVLASITGEDDYYL